MKADVVTLDAKKAGTIDLDEGLFGLPDRPDILSRVVHWQLAKRRAGTQSVKQRTQVSGTTKKFGKQKGGGSARHGSRKAGIFIGGGKVHGAQPRSYDYALPKKIRLLGLKSALSTKQNGGKLVIIDDLAVEAKTKALAEKLANLGLTSALFIDAQVNDSFKLAVRNIPHMDVLPVMGANVYDILRRDTLVLTKSAVDSLTERLK